MHYGWTWNLQVEPWFQCCQQGWHLYYPGSTRRGLLVMRLVEPAGGHTMQRAAVSQLPARGMTCAVSSVFISWSLGALVASSQFLTDVVASFVSSACTGHCSGCSHHMHSRFAPLLDTCLSGGSSHTYCSGKRWFGHQHAWKMLRRSLLLCTQGQLIPSPWFFGIAHIWIQAAYTGGEGTGKWAGTGPVGRSSLWPCDIKLCVAGPWFWAFPAFGHGGICTKRWGYRCMWTVLVYPHLAVA